MSFVSSKALCSLGALVLTTLIASTANATKLNFVTTLSPGEEVTPPTGLPSFGGPSGSAAFTYDDATKILCGRLSINANLTGAPSGIHVHQAPKGQPSANGSKVDKIVIPLPSTAKGSAGETYAFKAVLNAPWETSLVTGEIYANMHTTKNPDGEIRGSMARKYIVLEEIQCADLPTIPLTVAAPAADAGTDSGPSDDAGESTPAPSSNDESDAGPLSVGGDAGADSETTTTPAESGCNTSSSRALDGLPMGLLIGLLWAARTYRRNRRTAG